MKDDDPIVAEVRAIRARNNAEAEYDVAKVARRASEAVRELGFRFCPLKPVATFAVGAALGSSAV